MLRYEYLVAYAHERGSGRSFVTRSAPIDSAQQFEEMEKAVQESATCGRIIVLSFQLLRTYEDATCEASK